MRYRNSAIAIVLFCAVSIAAVWIFSVPTPNAMMVPESERRSVHIGGVNVYVDIADTSALREQGLSGRSELKENEGMLFVFPEDGVYTFWMKDMSFSIDMIWISKSGTVVHVENAATPRSYPETFGPDVPARYVLEVSAGFSEAHGVSVGDVVGL